MNKITLLCCEGHGGIPRYARELERNFNAMGHDAERRFQWAREYVVAGRRVGGLLTRVVGQCLPAHAPGRIIHATDHFSARRFQNPDFVTVHDVIWHKRPDLFPASDRMNQISTRALRRVLRTPAKVIVNSHATARDLEVYFGVNPDRINVTHLGVSGKFSPIESGRLFQENRSIFAIVVMDANPRKRADIAFQALSRIPGINVIHIGKDAPHFPAASKRFRDSVASLISEGRYTFYTDVSDDTLNLFLNASAVMVHITEDEGFSLPPLEALAAGVPVVVSDIPVHREILGKFAEYAGLNVGSVEGAILKVLNGHVYGTREERSRHAKRFTWEKTAIKTLQIYGE